MKFFLRSIISIFSWIIFKKFIINFIHPFFHIHDTWFNYLYFYSNTIQILLTINVNFIKFKKKESLLKLIDAS